MNEENTQIKETDPFYEDAIQYWEKIPPTIGGMLGGFGYISRIDIEGSKNFLNRIFTGRNPPGKEYALDCGAGIGRISKNLLLPIFKKVDLVEQNTVFVEKVTEFVGITLKHKLGTLYNIGLQNFTPETNKYDVIWCQWVLGHLKDEDLVEFLQRCKDGLKEHGIVVIKENISSSVVVKDDEDSSVTRPLKLFRKLIKKAGFISKDIQQTNFPKGLYAIRMFELRPVQDEVVANMQNTDIS